MRAAVEAVEAADGAVGALVNNAGYSQSGALETLPMERLRAQFETNVFGLLRMCQLALPKMRAAGRGPDRQPELDGRQAGLPRRRRLPRDQVRGRGALRRAAVRGQGLRRSGVDHRAWPDHDPVRRDRGRLPGPSRGRGLRGRRRPLRELQRRRRRRRRSASTRGRWRGSAAARRRSRRRSSGRSRRATRSRATRSRPRPGWRSASGRCSPTAPGTPSCAASSRARSRSRGAAIQRRYRASSVRAENPHHASRLAAVTGAASRRAKLLASLLICAAAAAPAGCGPDEEPDDPITISRSAGPTELDPALASGAGALEALWLVYTPLLTYRHAEGDKGAELIPGLAVGPARVSADGRTYALQLREGLDYSDGTGPRRATSSTLSPASSTSTRAPRGSTTASRAPASTWPRATPRRRSRASTPTTRAGEITIELDGARPRVRRRARAPVRGAGAGADPGSRPERRPAARRRAVRDRRRRPGRRLRPQAQPDLRRSSTSPTSRPATSPRSRPRSVRASARQAQDVLDGKLDYMQDPPPPALRPTILEQAGDRFARAPGRGHLYFTSTSGCRRSTTRWCARPSTAASTGRRSPGLRRRCSPGCALLAPGVPGYDERSTPTGARTATPPSRRDLAAARALIAQAGARGARCRGRGGRRPRRPRARQRLRADPRPDRARGERRSGAPRARRPASSPRPPASRARVGLLRLAAAGLDDPLVAGELERLGARRRSTPTRRPRRTGRGSTATWSRRRRATSRSLGHPTVDHLLLRAHGPGRRGLPSRVRQRLLELAAQGGRVAPGANGYECPPCPLPPTLSRLS